MYVYHLAGSTYPVHVKTKDDWLQAIRTELSHPKPPEWWLASQEREEFRTRTQASIIWASRYNTGRKFLIWSQAPDEDFIRLGYMTDD